MRICPLLGASCLCVCACVRVCVVGKAQGQLLGRSSLHLWVRPRAAAGTQFPAPLGKAKGSCRDAVPCTFG